MGPFTRPCSPQSHQQYCRRDVEYLRWDLLFIKPLVKLRHVVLGGHLSLHIGEMEPQLLRVLVLLPDVPTDKQNPLGGCFLEAAATPAPCSEPPSPTWVPSRAALPCGRQPTRVQVTLGSQSCVYLDVMHLRPQRILAFSEGLFTCLHARSVAFIV